MNNEKVTLVWLLLKETRPKWVGLIDGLELILEKILQAHAIPL